MRHETTHPAYEDVLRLAESYPDLPLEALFKEDLLRRGVDPAPLRERAIARFGADA